MVKTLSFQRGFSLIELMVTITILAILVTAGSAFTAQWSKQAELDKAVMSFQSAIDLAKSTAIRNEFATNTSLPASQICFDSSTAELTVRKASTSGSASCTSAIIFSSFLKNSIDIKRASDTASFQCFALNNYGQIISHETAEYSCKTDLNITIHNGTLNENLTFN